MKKIFLFFSCMVIASLGFGRVLSQDEMKIFAKQFVAQDSLQELFPQATVETVAWVEVKENLGLWHIDLAPKGHLILGSSTKYRALISWADEDFTFPETASPQYALLLRAAERCAIAEAGKGEEHPSWTIEVTDTAQRSVAVRDLTSIPETAIVHAPLDKTTWHQSTIMTWYVPGNAPCGCVATTMAQIMRVLEWPVYTEYAFENALPYTSSNHTTLERYRFSPYSKIDYSKMTEKLSSYTPVAHNNQIARLVLLNDILAEMNFTDKASGAVGEWAASTPWTIDPNCRCLDEGNGKISYTQEDINYIQQAMADKVPIACRVPSHSILGSGYAVYNGEPYVRFNYGWGGSDSGWYHIDDADAYDITYPKRTVQCDPLPAISSATPTLSWHLPTCYDDKISGFEITATEIKVSPIVFKWSDNFATLKGDIAGNTKALRNVEDPWNKGTYKLDVYYPNDDLTAPKILYTWQDILIPTETTKLNFTYQQRYNRGPIHFQVLPLGGVWETVYEIDTGSTFWSSASVDLSQYAKKPCQLRLFVYPTTNSLSYTFQYLEFSLKNLEVTNLSNVIGEPTETFTVNDANARNYTIPEGHLRAREKWAFMVKPIFKDKTKVGTLSMPCYTEIETVNKPMETFTTFTFEPASEEAFGTSNMRFDKTMTTRYCTYNGLSILRVQTEDNIKTLEVYSSHPDAFPTEAFSIERYGDGLFDIVIDGTKIPTSPRLNDRLNLTMVAITEAGTRTAHEFSLNFTTNTTTAQSETLGEVTLPAIAYTTEGKTLNIPRTWFEENNLVAKASNKSEYMALLTVDSDGDGLNNAEEYLVNANPMDATSMFKITGLTVKDGKVNVTYTPKPDETRAVVTLQGKETLSDVWEPHTDATTNHRFFRVRVTPRNL